MQIQLDTKEFKSILATLEGMSKKVPNDIAQGDSPIAILREANGFSVVCVREYFSFSAALKSAQVVGSDDGSWSCWNGASEISESDVVGVLELSKLTTLLAKLPADKTIDIAITDDRKMLELKAGTKKYDIACSIPRKVIGSYHGQREGDEAVVFSPAQFSWFCSTVSDLGSLISASVSNPAFGCVCLNAEPSKGGNLMMSGNSASEGFSVIYDTVMVSHVDFGALIPKGLAESLKSISGKMPEASGEVRMSVPRTEKERARELVFSCPDFSFSLMCVLDEFPFGSLQAVLDQARIPYCVWETKRDVMKKAADRLSVFDKRNEGVTDVTVLDGGAIELSQRETMSSKKKVADEVDNDGTLAHFPEEVPSLGTTVRTSVLKTAMNALPAKGDMQMVVCQAAPGKSRRMAFLTKDENADITAVLLGLKAED